MGFFDLYSGTDKIDLADVGAPGYHIEVRRFLSEEATIKVQRSSFGNAKLAPAGGITSDIQWGSFERAMVEQSVVAWNLDGPDGSVLPVKAENISKLPSVVFNKVFQHVNELNRPRTAEEQQAFRDSSGVGTEDGDGTTSNVTPISR